MNVTLGAADTAAKESTDEGKGSAEQKTSDFRLPFFNLKSWEEAIRDHTERPVIPQKPDEPDQPEKPDEPKDPTDELTAAYNRLVEEQSNFRLRLRREVNPGTYTYRWYEDEFERDGDITHFCEQNIYRDKTDEYFGGTAAAKSNAA